MDNLESTNFTHLGIPRRGKVRDIYDLGRYLFIVATDRLSAFDVVLPDIISRKGIILNQISLFWFKKMADIIENHIVAATYEDCPDEVKTGLKMMRDLVADRSVLVRKAEPLPVECIVRGYLSGSGWKAYQKNGTVCGIQLPEGLKESDKLPEPIFTPSTKVEDGHDINISFEEMAKLIGANLTRTLRAVSLLLYKKACDVAEPKGIIIADTKFEFGLLDGKLIIIDEVLTPDSSRFWLAANYQPGKSQDSFDKQIVRDYLLTLNWNQQYPGPKLPAEIIQKTADRYQEIYQILTT